MNKTYRVYIILIFLALAVGYQQCSNVTLQQETAMLNLVPNKLSGRFCSQNDSTTHSKYKLGDFYILNLTTRSFNGRLVADSNLNGVPDDDDSNSINTVTLSALDSDVDGVPDFVEKLKGLNPSRNDLDEDGYDLDEVINKKELQLGSDPESQKVTPEIIYTLQESTDTTECGNGQSAYTFNVTQIPSLANQEFTDPVNLNPDNNLSHLQNENIYLVLAKLLPENSANESLLLFKIFKHDAFAEFNFDFTPNDFTNLLNIQNPTCTTCSSNSVKHKFKQVATGRLHSCALSDAGKVLCWGNNQYGQLGNETNSPKLLPTLVKLNAEAKSISSGDYHTCAQTIAEEIYCWGSNEFGQLGNGSKIDSHSPVKVQSLTGAAKKISSGSDHNCAELGDSTIKCWGKNASYQLGSNNTSDSQVPVKSLYQSTLPVFPLKSLSSGFNHNCLVDKNGKAFCWGDIAGCFEQNIQPVPTKPTGGLCSTTATTFPIETTTSNLTYFFTRSTWSLVVTNGIVNYGINTSSSSTPLIYCWGQSIGSTTNTNYGCAGLGESSASYYSAGISNVLKLSMSQNRTCAIKKSGTEKVLECWGSSFETGQIQTIPQGIFEVKNPHDVSVAKNFICAIDGNGELWCWGDNSYGQLGNNTFINSTTPIKSP